MTVSISRFGVAFPAAPSLFFLLLFFFLVRQPEETYHLLTQRVTLHGAEGYLCQCKQEMLLLSTGDAGSPRTGCVLAHSNPKDRNIRMLSRVAAFLRC